MVRRSEEVLLRRKRYMRLYARIYRAKSTEPVKYRRWVRAPGEIPQKPPTELRRINYTEYQKLYGRWWRFHGQVGEGRPERPL